MIKKLLDLAVQIQQIPAPTFEEQPRAAFILDLFRQDGLSDVQQDAAGNVLARLPGGPNASLVVSAHLDTVFPAGTDLAGRRGPERIYGPGIGDNSLGVAGLFGLLWSLRAQNLALPADVWLVANTGEEGLGDLRGMKAVVERFQGTPKAYLVLEGMAFGHVYHQAVGVRRYKVTARAAGGHSWTDFGRPSAIHALAGLISRIAALKPLANPRTTYNVGRVGGGTTINTIAAEAWLELDMRSEGAAALADLNRQVDHLIAAAEQPGVRFDVQVIGQRPAGEIAPEHPLIRLAQTCLAEQETEAVLTAGSTDANIPLSQGYPALVLGLTEGGGAHTVQEFIETEPVTKGLAHIVNFVKRVWD
jgi:tripeptide aminopeptidase